LFVTAVTTVEDVQNTVKRKEAYIVAEGRIFRNEEVPGFETSTTITAMDTILRQVNEAGYSTSGADRYEYTQSTVACDAEAVSRCV